jgi:phosphoribosylglycinamide formyltransferase-1
MASDKHKIAIFASGSGTNAERFFEHFQRHALAEVSLLLTNNPKAGAIDRAKRFDIPVEIFDRATFVQTDGIVHLLQEKGIDFIVLAGFMWLVPTNLIKAFPNRIVNIHPALLPAYGGKGMYGMHVHQAIAAAKEKETGITIHYVNEKYDEGQIIFQISTPIAPDDTPEDIADKVHALEYQYYPKVVEELIQNI